MVAGQRRTARTRAPRTATITPPERHATSVPRALRRSPPISPAPAPSHTSPVARIFRAGGLGVRQREEAADLRRPYRVPWSAPAAAATGRRLAGLQREFMPMPGHQDAAASAGGPGDYAQVVMPGDHQ